MILRRTLAALVLFLATGASAADPPKPADESRRLPKTNLVRSEVVPTHIMSKTFMPGGTVGHYKKAKSEYEMFIAKLASPTAAAIALSDWRKTMTSPKLVASFGGYFGDDGGKPAFVFTKGAWVAGVRGLPQSEADLQARVLAGQIQ
jgi:hypothetical protein